MLTTQLRLNGKIQVIRTDRIALPKLDGLEPRAVAVVEYKDFVLCSTHLDLTLESQLGQIEVHNHYMDSVYTDCGKPVFIGGDPGCTTDCRPGDCFGSSSGGAHSDDKVRRWSGDFGYLLRFHGESVTGTFVFQGICYG